MSVPTPAKILDGATTRGSGVTIDAVILICITRNFTALSNLRPRDEVIVILKGYFDAMAEPIDSTAGRRRYYPLRGLSEPVTAYAFFNWRSGGKSSELGGTIQSELSHWKTRFRDPLIEKMVNGLYEFEGPRRRNRVRQVGR